MFYSLQNTCLLSRARSNFLTTCYKSTASAHVYRSVITSKRNRKGHLLTKSHWCPACVGNSIRIMMFVASNNFYLWKLIPQDWFWILYKAPNYRIAHINKVWKGNKQNSYTAQHILNAVTIIELVTLKLLNRRFKFILPFKLILKNSDNNKNSLDKPRLDHKILWVPFPRHCNDIYYQNQKT